MPCGRREGRNRRKKVEKEQSLPRKYKKVKTKTKIKMGRDGRMKWIAEGNQNNGERRKWD